MSNTQKVYDDLIETALNGLKEIGDKNPEQLKKWMRDQPFLPPSIPTRQNGIKFITADGLKAVRELGRTWFRKNPNRANILSREASEELAVRAFGDLLDAAKDLPDDTDLQLEILQRLEDRLQSQVRSEYFYFPACVFEQDDVETFPVGPVTFYKREEWVDIVESRASNLLAWKARVLRTWATGPRWWESLYDWAYKVTKRPNPQQNALDVLTAVGPAKWVAAVTIEGRDRSRSKNCASVAILVALDSLGLSLDLKTAGNLRGPGHQVESRRSLGLSQYDGYGLNWSWSMDIPRIGGRPGAQATYIHGTKKLLDAVGKALDAFITVQSNESATDLKRRWIEAMYWFGQSRREQSDFIALVKLGIALDVLAKGGKFRGILNMSSAVLQLQETDQITSDGRTLKKFVEKLYNEGRSQIAHGGRLALLQELPLERHLADSFSADVLLGYIACLEKYTGPDTYKDFLTALPALRAIL